MRPRGRNRHRGVVAAVLLAWAVLMSMAPALAAEDPAEARPLMEQVEALFAQRRFVEAIEPARRALDLRRAALGPSHGLIVESLGTLGVLLKRAGRLDEAEPIYREALQQANEVFGPVHLEVADAMDNLASLLAERGRFADAEGLYLRALDIGRQTHGPESLGHATSLNNLGALYRNTGRPELALPLFTQALEIYEKSGQPGDWRTIATRDNLVELHLSLRELEPAERLLRGESASSTMEGTVGALALLRFLQGRDDEAEPLMRRVVELHEQRLGPGHPLVAVALTNLGHLHWRQGRSAQALVLLQRAAAIHSINDAPATRWRTHALLSRALAPTDPEWSIHWGKRAVNEIQGLRAELSTAPAAAQRMFLADKAPAYTELADLLVSQGRVQEAQQVLQMLKEQELHELLRSGPGADPRSTRTGWTADEELQRSRIAVPTDRLAQLLKERQALHQRQRAAPGLSPAEQSRQRELDASLIPGAEADLQSAIEQARKGPASAGASGRNNPSADSRSRPSRLNAAVDALDAAVPRARVAGVQYLLAPKRLTIILTLPGRAPIARQIEVSAQDVRRAVLQTREMLRTPVSQEHLYRPVLRELHGWLLGPIHDELDRHQVRTLMVAAHDVLRYVPFAALHDGERYLVERMAVSQFNEAVDLVDPAASEPWRVAGLGLTRAVDGLSALPSVASELDALLGVRGIQGRRYLDEAFDRQRLRESLNGPYNTLHVASHFVFDAQRPDLSRLYLGDRTSISLSELDRDAWRFDRIRLVVLSACDTGVGGGTDGRGQEVEGLAALVQRQGAHSAVLTLWRIADASTPRLMQRFYADLGSGLSKAEAMQSAQIQMLREGRGRAVATPVDAIRHPFYWAGFMVAGNWR
jgi:CHAT domain-containing protein